jgi:two-component system OmpR family sensor kinase
VIAVILLVVLTLPATHWESVRVSDLTTVLSLAAVAAGATGAILSRMSAHLRRDARSLWLCLALSLYTLVAIPAATVGASSRWDEAAVGNVRLFTHTVFVALIYLIAGAPRILTRFTVSAGMLGLLVLAAVLVWSGERYPMSCLAVTTSPVVRWGLAVLWVTAPLCVMGHAVRTRCVTAYRVGLALEIVAVAHTLRVYQGSPVVPFDLSFSSVRLLGIVLLLWEAVGVTRTCLTGVDRANYEQQERLNHAQMKLQRVSERDHELRNGLAGLAGATKYIHVGGEQSLALHRAVTTELARLNAMMRKTPDVEPFEMSRQAVPERYPVEEILANQVALRRSTGMDIRLDADPQLCTSGSPAALAQVISNLLANCERHAPGSPVRIQARGAGSTVRIRLTDFGPGFPTGTEQVMFQLGARGSDSTGQGIGLHVSDHLVRQHSGTITVIPSRPDRPGCTVIIELPLAPAKIAPLHDSAA